MAESPENARDRNAGGGLLRAFDVVLDAGAALAAALLLAVMLITLIKVFLRYGLGEGLIGVDQSSGTMLLYITFLGAGWVLRREEHVTIDLMLVSLPREGRRRLHLVSSVLCALVCFALAALGALEVISSWQHDIRIPAEIEIPRAVNLVVIPLGCFVLGLQFVRRAWMCLRGWEPAATAPMQGG